MKLVKNYRYNFSQIFIISLVSLKMNVEKPSTSQEDRYKSITIQPLQNIKNPDIVLQVRL